MLAALAGGAALMGRGKKKFGTDAGFLKSAAAGGARLSTPPIHGTDHIPVEQKVVEDTPAINDTRFRTRHRITDSAGNTIPSTNKMVNIARMNAPKGIYPPGSVPMPRTGVHPRSARGSIIGRYKKGGRVTGIAKRGFGRALMKGKK